MMLISESGLYTLIMRSNKPEAKVFRKWLTQVQLAELYRSSVQNVGHHIGNILEDEELPADSTIKDSFIVAAFVETKTRSLKVRVISILTIC